MPVAQTYSILMDSSPDRGGGITVKPAPFTLTYAGESYIDVPSTFMPNSTQVFVDGRLWFGRYTEGLDNLGQLRRITPNPGTPFPPGASIVVYYDYAITG
jgi:hypothetical protein